MRLRKERLFWALLGLYFLFFLLLNVLTPLVSDDYRYAFSFATGERITNFWQIFPSLYEHYFTMHGRTAVHFFTQLMLLLGKPVFNVLNAAVAALLLLGLYRLAAGRGKKNLAVLLGLGALSFLFTPAFGQTMLWLDGACNYLWGVAILIWVLVPFRDAVLGGQDENAPKQGLQKRENDSKPPSGSARPGRMAKKASPEGSSAGAQPERRGLRSPWLLGLFLLGSLFLGAASENYSPAAVLLMAACTGVLWKRTGKLPWRLAAASALAAAGFLVLVLSPANAIRSANYAAAGVSRAGQYLLNFKAAAQTLLGHGLPLCFVFLALFALAALGKADKNRLLFAALLFLAGLAANFAMTLSNGYPLRAMMGCAVFLLAGIALLLPDVFQGAFCPLALGALACAVFAALLTAASILPGNYNRYSEAKSREAYVMEQRDLGNLNVTTYTLEGMSRYDVFDNITDISFDQTYWPNVYFGKYYGLESVVTDTIR